MKSLIALFFSVLSLSVFGNSWSYQVNVNGHAVSTKPLDDGRTSFDAGPYYCEVTPISESNGTEFRTLLCSVGAGSVSTGGLCTKKGSKFPSVQYAILNMNGPKHHVNVVVSCKFD